MPTALFLPTYPAPLEIRTARCLLRQWREDDLPAWIAMNQDPAVREHFPTIPTPTQAAGEMQRIQSSIAHRGWGAWALEIPSTGTFAGFVGLMVPVFDAPWQPAVEIGWRLAKDYWGKGYVTETAKATMQFAFERLQMQEVVAITVPANTRSRAVMARLGMTRRQEEDFDHPRVETGHPMKRHVLYRLRAADWKSAP